MPNPFARIVRGLVHAFRGQRAAQVAAETASNHNASVGAMRPAPGVPVPGQPSQMWPATAQGFAPLNYAPADYDGLPAENYPKPYTDVSELDPTGYETDTMREAYIELHRSNPEVRSAIEGKVAAVARLDLSLLPADEDNPRDREVAEWCQWCIDAGGGSDALISEMLTPALISGWSVGEVKRNTNPRHLPVKFRDRPRWSLEYVRQLDTRLIKPQLDVYRNIKALVSFVRGAERALPERYLIFTHHRFLHNPFGQSDLRAAFRSARMIDDAYKLWYVLIRNYGGPVILGKAGVGTQSSRAFLDRFDKALKECRQSGWIRCAAEDEVEVINLASAVSFEAFQSKIKAHREAILLAVRGAYLPFVEGSGNNPRGDTAVNKMASNDVEELLARAVARALTQQLLPLLVVPNYGRDCPMPRVQLGGKIQAEIDAALGNADKLQKMGLPVGKKWLYKTANVPPPMDPGDAVSPPGQGGPGGPGMPGLGGGPQPGGPGGPGGDADPANDLLLQLFGGGDSGGGGDQAGGQQVPQLGGGAAAPNQHIPPRPGLVWNAPASRYRAVDNFSSPPQPQADGCVLVPLPDAAAAAVRRVQAGLDPADVLEHEDQPHLTLRYGLLPVSPPAVANCLAGEGCAFDVGPRLGLFRQPEADVLYLAAEGDDPARLHRLLGYLPNRTDKEYVPHVTVAYLKPGAGDRYLARPAGGEAVSVFADWCSYHPAGGGQAVRVPLADDRDTFASHPGDSVWQPYTGKNGGKGWVNQYGTVVYQASKPASRGGKPQVSGNAGSPGHQPGAGGVSPTAAAGGPAGSGSSPAQGGAARHNPHDLIKKLGAGQALSDDEAKALPGLVMGMGVFELRAVRGHLGVASTGLKHEVANRIVAAAQAKQAQLGGSPIPGQGAAGGATSGVASPPAPPPPAAPPAQPASPPPAPAAPPPPAAPQAANAGTSPAAPVSAASSSFGPVVKAAAAKIGVNPAVLPTMQDAILVHHELMHQNAINAGVSPADVQIELINQHVSHGKGQGQPAPAPAQPASPPAAPPPGGTPPTGPALLQKIAAGQPLDAAEHAALPGLVMAMSVPDLRAARQALGVQASGLRSAYAAKILAAAQAKNQQLGGAAPPPAPPVAAPVARGPKGGAAAPPAAPAAPATSAAAAKQQAIHNAVDQAMQAVKAQTGGSVRYDHLSQIMQAVQAQVPTATSADVIAAVKAQKLAAAKAQGQKFPAAPHTVTPMGFQNWPAQPTQHMGAHPSHMPVPVDASAPAGAHPYFDKLANTWVGQQQVMNAVKTADDYRNSHFLPPAKNGYELGTDADQRGASDAVRPGLHQLQLPGAGPAPEDLSGHRPGGRLRPGGGGRERQRPRRQPPPRRSRPERHPVHPGAAAGRVGRLGRGRRPARGGRPDCRHRRDAGARRPEGHGRQPGHQLANRPGQAGRGGETGGACDDRPRNPFHPRPRRRRPPHGERQARRGRDPGGGRGHQQGGHRHPPRRRRVRPERQGDGGRLPEAGRADRPRHHPAAARPGEKAGRPRRGPRRRPAGGGGGPGRRAARPEAGGRAAATGRPGPGRAPARGGGRLVRLEARGDPQPGRPGA